MADFLIAFVLAYVVIPALAVGLGLLLCNKKYLLSK